MPTKKAPAKPIPLSQIAAKCGLSPKRVRHWASAGKLATLPISVTARGRVVAPGDVKAVTDGIKRVARDLKTGPRKKSA